SEGWPGPRPLAGIASPPLPFIVRRFGLLQATALNMINMIGMGPFIKPALCVLRILCAFEEIGISQRTPENIQHLGARFRVGVAGPTAKEMRDGRIDVARVA